MNGLVGQEDQELVEMVVLPPCIENCSEAEGSPRGNGDYNQLSCVQVTRLQLDTLIRPVSAPSCNTSAVHRGRCCSDHELQ